MGNKKKRFWVHNTTIFKTSGLLLASKIKWSNNTNVKTGNSQGVQNLGIFRGLELSPLPFCFKGKFLMLHTFKTPGMASVGCKLNLWEAESKSMPWWPERYMEICTASTTSLQTTKATVSLGTSVTKGRAFTICTGIPNRAMCSTNFLYPEVLWVCGGFFKINSALHH